MLFSSPDYPVFLIALFFLYALARWGGERHAWARIAVMVVLGDVLFMLIAKDPDALWDPIGGAVCRWAAGREDWPGWLLARWVAGSGVLVGAIWSGRRFAPWLASDRGQRTLARGLVVILATIGALVLTTWRTGELDAVTASIVDGGHLVVLAVLGIGIGASRSETRQLLGRVVILFVASSLFYHAWAAEMPGPYRYLLALLLATIALDYYLGIWIENATDPRVRKLLVILSLVSNLGILVFFKYADFFARGVLQLDVEPLQLILPAGISFHTFQSLSYTIDVYRGEVRATRSIVEFATFVLFFPQLVAGPIVRAKDLLPQLQTLPHLDLDRARAGMFRIVVGLFKKIAIADTLAISIVDRVFEAPERFSSIEVLVGVYAYALQIYLDFSAYSDIAIGSAMVLGFTLPENFRTPYRAANLQEFWRRWHISLSTWLRDYLYIALGGSRGAAWRTYVNLILTMVLGGLWHGASWAFVVWGALHGFGLAVTRYFQRATSDDPRRAWSLLVWCGTIATAGVALHATLLTEQSTWWQLVGAWIYLTPLWAVATAWLGREQPAAPQPAPVPSRFFALGGAPLAAWLPEALRLAMCSVAVMVFAAVDAGDETWWVPLAALAWGIALVADIVERGAANAVARLARFGRRVVAVILVFHYVCLAWVFFRAETFDAALVILQRIAAIELDHANVGPVVSVALAVGFASHFWPDASFRWLRDAFVALPTRAQGYVLVTAALVLRELAQPLIVPFIYFQF